MNPNHPANNVKPKGDYLKGKKIWLGVTGSVSCVETVGITRELSKKISALDLVKIGSSILGGKGGGGRDDFAQAGGEKIERIEESYKEILKKLI